MNSGKPTPGAKVVLIPSQEQSRQRKDRFFISEADPAGKFVVQGIPPEPYMAFAFENIDSDVYYDPDFIALIMSRAISIRTGRETENNPLILITRDDLARMVP